MSYAKPVPTPSKESQPYWDSARDHALRLQKCAGCGAFRFPPSPVCPECWGKSFAWEPISGRGKIYTFCTYRRLYHPGFGDDLPYVLAVIALEDGPRLLSNVIDCRPEDVRCDMPVEVVYRDVTDAISLPLFRPAKT
jgi:uncharacterized OB-fold protein